MNNIEVHERPVLLDRIQLTVSPRYSEIFDKNNKLPNGRLKLYEKYESYKSLLIEKCKSLKNDGYKSERTFPNGKFQYFIVLPEEATPSYVSNVKISPFAPFVVAMKINFIRLLRDKLMGNLDFRYYYDKSILLDEDNYINYEIWPYWDPNVVSNLLNDLDNICLDIAEKTMKNLNPDYDLTYHNVVVNEIEANVDIYVGNNNSLFAIEQYPRFVYSDDGKEFKKEILATAVNCRVPDDSFKSDVDSKEKNSCYSLGFNISKDLYFKIYRKDTDHVRAELMFNKWFLTSKFKEERRNDYTGKQEITSSRNIKRIVRPVLEFSKTFFKRADLVNVFYNILSEKRNVVSLNQLNDLHDFYLKAQPEMIPIIDSIVNGVPIVDREIVTFLRRHPNMRKQFCRDYDGNGRWIYVYNPIQADINREKRMVAHPLKTKSGPKPAKRRYSWEVKKTNEDRKALSQKFERWGYHKQLPYSYDFKDPNPIPYEKTIWFQKDLDKQNALIKKIK